MEEEKITNVPKFFRVLFKPVVVWFLFVFFILFIFEVCHVGKFDFYAVGVGKDFNKSKLESLVQNGNKNTQRPTNRRGKLLTVVSLRILASMVSMRIFKNFCVGRCMDAKCLLFIGTWLLP